MNGNWKRLLYVDMARGFAVIWMISLQLLQMFSKDFRYGSVYWLVKINWLPIFFIIVGFSLKLMLDKYGALTFAKRSMFRAVLLIGLGGFLVLWVSFEPDIINNEVVSSIGINIIFLTVALLLFKALSQTAKVLCFLGLAFVMVLLQNYMQIPGHFNPVWCLSFMFFGVALALCRNSRRVQSLIGLIFLVIGSIFWDTINIYQRTWSFWIFNCGFVVVLLILMSMLERTVAAKFLSYMGRHSLFFYFFHFAIFRKILLLTDSLSTFDWIPSILFTLFSIISLILLEKIVSRTHVVPRLMGKIFKSKV
ncbi:MAG: DUF1624 domain-containing protein [Candidatus Bathyarchaeota archaeon]|nr:MAG: DUF1624 domain-containing protein [Candidatus Bathyarchaeota archaeon]